MQSDPYTGMGSNKILGQGLQEILVSFLVLILSWGLFIEDDLLVNCCKWISIEMTQIRGLKFKLMKGLKELNSVIGCKQLTN